MAHSHFLQTQLTPVDSSTLPEDERDCSICYIADQLVRTPCGHLFCRPCITHWLAEPGANTCPTRRRLFFEYPPDHFREYGNGPIVVIEDPPWDENHPGLPEPFEVMASGGTRILALDDLPVLAASTEPRVRLERAFLEFVSFLDWQEDRMTHFGLGLDVSRYNLIRAAMTAYHYLDQRNGARPARFSMADRGQGASQKALVIAMAYMLPCLSALSRNAYTAEQRDTWRDLVERLGALMQDNNYASATADALRSELNGPAREVTGRGIEALDRDLDILIAYAVEMRVVTGRGVEAVDRDLDILIAYAVEMRDYET